MEEKSEIEIALDDQAIALMKYELRARYEQNIEFLLSHGYILKTVDFDDLPFWLISTGVRNKYYVYDIKEKKIRGNLYLEYHSNRYLPLSIPESFADALILEEWNLHTILPYSQAMKKNNKKSYIVVKDLGRFLSCFQVELLSEDIISDVLIFDGFSDMKEYFLSCSAYLPRNIIDFMHETNQAQKLIDEIHNYRISKEGRRGDNILLSICIPSWNRGNRAYANVLHNLTSYYDEELEIVLSNNGTQNESKDYYEQISKIRDARLKYFAFEENQGFALNLCKVAELAMGKFIMLLSDEDMVNLDYLPKVMKMLHDGQESLAIVKTKGDIQLRIPSTKLAESGEDALLTYMLTSNYMSGIFLSRRLMAKYEAIKYLKENLDNSVCSYYPHMFWELLLCQYGNVMGADILLINEGKAEVDYTATRAMPSYASLEGRLEQHKDFVNIFKDLEICQKEIAIFRKMYIKLCIKTIFLVSLSISVFYAKTDMDLLEILNKAYEVCLKYLDDIYDNQSEVHKQYYAEDSENIKKIYLRYQANLMALDQTP